jgi:Zn-dependent oligopeptidase
MRMAETPEKVSNFLSDLTEKMTPLGKNDLQSMLELKAEEVIGINRRLGM